MKLQVHVYLHADPEIGRKLDRILNALETQGENVMTKLDDILAKAKATLEQARKNTDLENSIKALVQRNAQMILDLKAQLEAAGTDPAKLEELGSTMEELATNEQTEATNLAEAAVENTPAA